MAMKLLRNIVKYGRSTAYIRCFSLLLFTSPTGAAGVMLTIGFSYVAVMLTPHKLSLNAAAMAQLQHRATQSLENTKLQYGIYLSRSYGCYVAWRGRITVMHPIIGITQYVSPFEFFNYVTGVFEEIPIEQALSLDQHHLYLTPKVWATDHYNSLLGDDLLFFSWQRHYKYTRGTGWLLKLLPNIRPYNYNMVSYTLDNNGDVSHKFIAASSHAVASELVTDSLSTQPVSLVSLIDTQLMKLDERYRKMREQGECV
jgi:hypothetical protein